MQNRQQTFALFVRAGCGEGKAEVHLPGAEGDLQKEVPHFC